MSWHVPGYVHRRELGNGTSGRVVLAVSEASGELVIIKYLKVNPETLDRVREEVVLISTLDSGYIGRIREYIEDEDRRRAAIVMDAFNGTSLRSVLRDHGALAPEAALLVFRDSLFGLVAAHDIDIAHGDFRPENVLVDAGGSVLIVDMGVESWVARDITLSTGVYLAPERWHGSVYSTSADVYALSVTFAEMYLGEPPYWDTSQLLSLRYMHEQEELPLAGFPVAFRDVVRLGLAKDAEARADAMTLLELVEVAAIAEFGESWELRGRSLLTERIALLSLPIGDTEIDEEYVVSTAELVELDDYYTDTAESGDTLVVGAFAAGAVGAVAADELITEEVITEDVITEDVVTDGLVEEVDLEEIDLELDEVEVDRFAVEEDVIEESAAGAVIVGGAVAAVEIEFAVSDEAFEVVTVAEDIVAVARIEEMAAATALANAAAEEELTEEEEFAVAEVEQIVVAEAASVALADAEAAAAVESVAVEAVAAEEVVVEEVDVEEVDVVDDTVLIAGAVGAGAVAGEEIVAEEFDETVLVAAAVGAGAVAGGAIIGEEIVGEEIVAEESDEAVLVAGSVGAGALLGGGAAGEGAIGGAVTGGEEIVVEESEDDELLAGAVGGAVLAGAAAGGLLVGEELAGATGAGAGAAESAGAGSEGVATASSNDEVLVAGAVGATPLIGEEGGAEESGEEEGEELAAAAAGGAVIGAAAAGGLAAGDIPTTQFPRIRDTEEGVLVGASVGAAAGGGGASGGGGGVIAGGAAGGGAAAGGEKSFLRRHPWTSALVGIILILICGGVALTITGKPAGGPTPVAHGSPTRSGQVGVPVASGSGQVGVPVASGSGQVGVPSPSGPLQSGGISTSTPTGAPSQSIPASQTVPATPVSNSSTTPATTKPSKKPTPKPTKKPTTPSTPATPVAPPTPAPGPTLPLTGIHPIRQMVAVAGMLFFSGAWLMFVFRRRRPDEA